MNGNLMIDNDTIRGLSLTGLSSVVIALTIVFYYLILRVNRHRKHKSKKNLIFWTSFIFINLAFILEIILDIYYIYHRIGNNIELDYKFYSSNIILILVFIAGPILVYSSRWVFDKSLNDLLDILPIGVIKFDDKLNTTYINNSFRKIINAPTEKLLNVNLMEYLVPSNHDYHKERLDKLFTNITDAGVTGTTESIGIRRDGTQFPVNLTTVMRINSDGKIEIIVNIEDLTEQKKYEQSLTNHLEKIKQVSYAFRHDVAATLSPALTALDYIKEVGYDKDAFELAYSQVKSTVQLNQALSEWSALIEKNGCDIDKSNIDIKEVIESIHLSNLKIIIKNDLKYVNANKGLFKNALRNLLDNMEKYSISKYPKIEIWRENKKIFIRDNAGGFGCIDGKFNTELANKLLQPGQRKHLDIIGTGLGMSNLINILELHGFSLEYDSMCDVGTTWTINI